MGVGSCLAAYSGGMSIGQPAISQFFVLFIVAGTLFSLLVRTMIRNSRWINADGLLYGLALAVAIFFINDLNRILNEGGFPRQLMAAAWLCWMLALGSFVTWRDGTLLFQAVPSIALFGLVGCYDTFREVTFAFFGFLICLAILFARTHSRDMLKMAVLSGFFNRADAPNQLSKLPDQDAALFEQIKKSAWRWAAGPEWALASALVIIALSLLGAPVIRESVSSVAGFVPVSQPVIRSTASTVATQETETQKIGQGPNSGLSKKPLYEVTVDGNRYWRIEGFSTYSGKGWRAPTGESRTQAADKDSSAAITEIRDPLEIPFTVKALVATHLIPAPGEPVMMSNTETLQPFTPGSALANGVAGATFEGTSIVPRIEQIARDAQPLSPHSSDLLSLTNVPQSVIAFAKSKSRGETSDFQKAKSIQHAIESSVKYNLHASAIPQDKDPVEYFLFEGKEGYCDLFASSMVVTARAIGIPARYMTGFLPEPANVIGGKQIIVEADYHAWAELYFKNVGWVVFDATQGAQSVEDGARGSTTDAAPWYKSQATKTVLYGLLVIGPIGGLGFAFVTRKKPIEKNIRRAELDKSYLRFTKALEKASGKRRLVSQTPDEFLNAVIAHNLGLEATARVINQKFVALFYAPGELNSLSTSSIESEVKAFAKLAKTHPKILTHAVVENRIENPDLVGKS